jgi:DNA-binding FadR family transcriptional regulator
VSTPGTPEPSSAFERIRPAYQQIADQIQGAVIRGDLKPGDRLPTEVELGTNFGVSRGTVREALRQLASFNLIYSVRGAGGGTFIADSDHGRISNYLETNLSLMTGSGSMSSDDVVEIRDLLEIRAAHLAALRRTPEHLERLRDAIDREKSEARKVPRLELTQRFHEVLLEASGNALLGLLTPPVVRVIHARFREDVPTAASWPDLDGDHERILACVAAGDAVGASEAMRDHLQRMWNVTAEHVDRLETPAAGS